MCGVMLMMKWATKEKKLASKKKKGQKKIDRRRMCERITSHLKKGAQ